MIGSCREALPDVREGSGGPPRCSGMVGMPSRMSGSVLEAFPYASSCWKGIPDVREWSGGLPA